MAKRAKGKHQRKSSKKSIRRVSSRSKKSHKQQKSSKHARKTSKKAVRKTAVRSKNVRRPSKPTVRKTEVIAFTIEPWQKIGKYKKIKKQGYYGDYAF